MKTIIELNEKDIKDIISKVYNTSLDNIEISYPTELRGYGLNEMEVTTIEVKVVI